MEPQHRRADVRAACGGRGGRLGGRGARLRPAGDGRRDRSRFALLSAVAEIGTGTQTLEATAARVTALIVPAAADLCVIDVAAGGELRRLAVRAHGPGREAALAAAPPAVVTGTSRVVRARSTMVVPLVARGRTLGALTMRATAGSGRAYEHRGRGVRARARGTGRSGARQRGPLLGAVPSPGWERVRPEIPAGAILVFYTDGVLDATARDRERCGEQRVARTLAGAADAQDAVTRIDRALRAFQTGQQADDTAVLAIERLG